MKQKEEKKKTQKLGRKRLPEGVKKEYATFSLKPANKNDRIPFLRAHFNLDSASELIDFLVEDKYLEISK
jgi:hypothetical protein